MYLSLNKCTKFCLIFLMIALLTLGGVTHAKNPDLSYWMANISESAQADELAEYDYPPEIKVVGNTIHMLWFTRNADWSGHKLYYRRSTDNGVTWDDKQLIFESDDLIYDNTYRRMAVSGNYVHIAISHYEGSWYGVLSYFRSNNGGASFETRKDLFTAAGAYHVYDIYVSAELANVTVGFRNQCNWCVDNQYFLKISSDNGATFNQKTAYATTSGSSWKVGDMQRRGNYIYVLYTDAYYYYGLQYSRLYVAASNDAGVTFQTTKLSFPSKMERTSKAPLCRKGITFQRLRSPKPERQSSGLDMMQKTISLYSFARRRATERPGMMWKILPRISCPLARHYRAGRKRLPVKGIISTHSMSPPRRTFT